MHFIKSGRGRLLCGVGGFEKENSEIETDELIQFLVGGEELKEREKRGRGKRKKKLWWRERVWGGINLKKLNDGII